MKNTTNISTSKREIEIKMLNDIISSIESKKPKLGTPAYFNLTQMIRKRESLISGGKSIL